MAQFSWIQAPETPTCSPRGPKSRPSHPLSAPKPSAFLPSEAPSAGQFSSSSWEMTLPWVTRVSEGGSAARSPSELPPQSPHLLHHVTIEKHLSGTRNKVYDISYHSSAIKWSDKWVNLTHFMPMYLIYNKVAWEHAQLPHPNSC